MTTAINNTLDEEDELWGFYVDIENIVINKNIIPKNKKIYFTLEDISEEFEYYSNQQSINKCDTHKFDTNKHYMIMNTSYKNNKNLQGLFICNLIYNSVIILLLWYIVFCVI